MHRIFRLAPTKRVLTLVCFGLSSGEKKFASIAPDVNSPKDLTDEHVETFVKSLVTRSDEGSYDYVAIESALKGFAMSIDIIDADARITHYVSDFFER